MRPDPGPARTGPRAVLRGVGAAFALAWRAGPHLTLGYGLITLVQAGVPVLVAWLTKAVLDMIVAPEPSTEGLAAVAVGLAAAGVITALTPHAGHYLTNEVERRVSLVSQDRLFAGTERFTGLSRFEDPAFLDRLRLAQQSGGRTPGVVVNSVFTLAGGVVTILGFLGSLLLISPWMAVAVLLSALPALVVELRLSRDRAAMMWRIGPVERKEIFFRELLSNVQAAKELRLFGTARFLRGRMARERSAANAELRSMDLRVLGAQGGLGLVSAGIAGAGLVWTVLAAADGRVSVGDVSLFVVAVAGVQAAMAGLVRDLTLAHHELLLFDHYLAVLDAPPDLPVRAAARPVPPLRNGIEFRDVWFRYSPDHPWALRGVDLTVEHGRSVGLIGRNGAGKSTLVKLLCRMYDPERGTILWDGVDLRELDPGELRDRIGAVFQDFMEYDLSAGENIGLGDVGILESGDRAPVREAAVRAGADDLITGLPRGYDTLLSRLFFDSGPDADDTMGVPLSGGQWQRLALARAYLRGHRDLLILDEPGAGLDAEAEHAVHSGLREHRRGRTSLLISHRLGAVRDADRLIVLEEGRVAESGTHAELVSAGGLYAHLFGLQAEGYRTGPAEGIR
ncbi:ABC transporter ATP-binding protein [Nocardiopsis sp. N85]|uniref:ABC transporter ATP-binding protein n=1 Tax=Nocardiopsis sp. N85 TaxID=3029400 RepID=UPI00237F4C8A|nr:ABC transporter ATP-binding protein [Nocardiopsis sp. N85]MDE3724926.1 ABC transporter ATP-binding protein [Nocardiopsis sp. N85]